MWVWCLLPYNELIPIGIHISFFSLQDLSQLSKLKAFVNDKSFCDRWMTIKKKNKHRLANYIKTTCGISVSSDALFDVQVD